ncbi:hypothetical protein I7I51_06555 [Histoplasma capsulatum]|uniref:Uncharacterized protein n=1 Tax=Ajellomyces capsulatus TaxID=5037 RepID=A0A8A1MNS1_AJECA|nr:hypothetical protein I7I51_06555 [Histoplasma capsulatum]
MAGKGRFDVGTHFPFCLFGIQTYGYRANTASIPHHTTPGHHLLHCRVLAWLRTADDAEGKGSRSRSSGHRLTRLDSSAPSLAADWHGRLAECQPYDCCGIAWTVACVLRLAWTPPESLLLVLLVHLPVLRRANKSDQ